MTESDYTRKLVKAIRTRLPRAITFKHSDMFTMGVPDFTITRGGLTTWFEAKKLETTLNTGIVVVRPVDDVPAAQWETLRRLIRGYLVIYTVHGHALVHVTGARESVGNLQLKLVPMEVLVEVVISVAEDGGREIT